MRTCQQFWFPRRDGCFRSTLSFKSQARDSGADWRVKKTPRWIRRAAGEVIEKGTALSVPLTMGNNVTPILEQSKGELGLVIKDPKSISHTHFPRVITPKFPTSKVSANLSSPGTGKHGSCNSRGKQREDRLEHL